MLCAIGQSAIEISGPCALGNMDFRVAGEDDSLSSKGQNRRIFRPDEEERR